MCEGFVRVSSKVGVGSVIDGSRVFSCTMSDADSPALTPRSPLDGDENVTLTEEQIQHVFIGLFFDCRE